MAELIVPGEVVSVLLQPPQTVRGTEQAKVIEEGAIDRGQGDRGPGDRAAEHRTGDLGEEPGPDHRTPAEHQAVGARDREALGRVLDRKYPAVGDDRDLGPCFDSSDRLPSRTPGKGFVLEPGMD